jgi:hypothetical protein
MSEVMRLMVAGVFPAAHSVIGIARRRSLDIVAVIVIVGISVSIVATFVGGDPKLLLIRESFVTGALGLLGLSSMLWKRPLMFHIGRIKCLPVETPFSSPASMRFGSVRVDGERFA